MTADQLHPADDRGAEADEGPTTGTAQTADAGRLLAIALGTAPPATARQSAPEAD